MQSYRSLKLNAPIKDNAGLKKVQFVSFLHSLCFVTQRRKVVYVVDCRIDYSRISTFDLFALRWGSWLWCQQWMKNKSLCRHIPLIVLPIKTYNSMIYSNFSAKTLKTILTRLQIVCICFTTVDENKPYTIWNIILNKIRDLARREFHMSSRWLLNKLPDRQFSETLIFFGGGRGTLF